PCLIIAFVERWHEETSSFHMPTGEIIVILDDMSCLLHLTLGRPSARPHLAYKRRGYYFDGGSSWIESL
ncbi:serine/threonine-protein phosphatase 7 long form-like protein, partial [Trifolium medium]|nr:serine/threonine-protein phosphatase 7 long form-like protein [Trifolium medium]